MSGPPANSILIWQPVAQANVYNVYRGLVPIAGWGFQSACLMPEAASLQLAETQSPPRGFFFYYLPGA